MFRSFKGDHKNRNPVFNFQRIRRNFKKKKAPSIQHKPGGISEKLVKLNENGWPKLEVALSSDIQGV